MKLTRKSIEKMIEHADENELDALTGDVVRLSEDELSELKAMLWLAKDDETPKHWEALVIEARFQLDDKTAQFITNTPDLGDKLKTALGKLEAAGRV